MLKKGDLVLLTILLVIVLAAFVGIEIFKGGDNRDRVAVVKQGDIIVKRINLNNVKGAESFEISGEYKETILVEKGRIRFAFANCPDKLCVKKGWLSRKGDVAVCIPNRVIINIEGFNGKVDGVTY